MADDAAKVLIDAGVPFYQRGKWLVRPVVVPVQSFHGKTTNAAQLVEVELPYLRDTLCQNSCWVKYRRPLEEVEGHPSAGGSRAGAAEAVWRLDVPGARRDHLDADAAPRRHDPAGRGLRSSDAIAADRSADDAGHPGAADARDALAALELLKDLLVEFPFVDDEGVSLAVALVGDHLDGVPRRLSRWCRCTSSTRRRPGRGKSYLLSTVSWIATGQAMPVLGSGRPGGVG